ncbi:quercetin 2,3-dioxygenase [Microbacterium sp. STN6]|uniref:quercetin 2,3-dioxygenase n=1 Tax=Microbacterium sp. STN6 TaxID=2995588 RepID=UPI002260AF59|nr:quercetin 2,3-dioxygenase [Microbacterium sp. STN6]MCX7520767.1 quercetin 2,3-dioxygenase [Microbacterium sp. STN6]
MSSNPPAPIVNQRPGEVLPYYMAAGEGSRYELNGQLVTVIAGRRDTDLFSAAYVSGGRGLEIPFTSVAGESQTFIVFDGRLEFWLPSEGRILTAGDEVVVPAGTPFAYRMLSHYTRFFVWSMPGRAIELVERLGTPVDAHVHPQRSERAVSLEQLAEAGAEFGVTFPDLEKTDARLSHDAQLPAGVEPYFLTAGEGDRRVGYNQMNTYLSRGRNTGSDYFTMQSTGSAAPYIPLHFHNRHTENFLCLDGRVWLHVNGREVLLTKGDFVHAPAGTIHSYAWGSNRTQMVGILAPAIFEKFFEYMFEPTDEHVYYEGGEPYFPGEAFGRVQAELDVVVVGPPPERTKALDI